MENIQALTPEGITGLLAGSAPIEFTGQSRTERYAWIETTLAQRQYFSLSKKQRGPVRALLSKVAGLRGKNKKRSAPSRWTEIEQDASLAGSRRSPPGHRSAANRHPQNGLPNQERRRP